MDTDRLKRLFLGSKLRIVGTVLLALIAVVVVGYLLGVFGVPSVESVDNRFGGVNDTTTVVETDLVVNNPNPFGIQLGGTKVEYAVRMNDVRMAEGVHEGISVGTGNSTLNFTSYIHNDKIPDWWVSHVDDGERTTLSVDATVHSSLLPVSVAAPDIGREITTNITSAFNSTATTSIDANQPLVSDPVLYVNETSGHWGEVTDAKTGAVMTFVVYNPKPYPIGASEIGYNISMNGIPVGEGATTSEVVIPPGETREITATTAIRNGRLDDWWVSHLERNQRTTLAIDFYARIDLSNGGFGTFRIPLDTMRTEFETDIFGTKAESNATGSDGNGTDGEATGTPTPSDGESTATATPTPTQTPTDDGGLLDGSDTPTATPTATPTDTPTPTPTDTPTDDGLI